MSISLNNVSYSYKGKYQTVRAVDGVSYDFEPTSSRSPLTSKLLTL